MNTILLIFFAIPLAVIIFSIALQKLLKCPALVAGIIFAIGVIITFIIGNVIVLAATLVYTFISYITALIICLISRCNNHDNDDHCCGRNRCCNNNENDLLTISSRCQNNGNGDLLTINSSCANGNTNNLLTISGHNNGRCCCNNDNDNGCGCGNNNDFNTANTINGVIRIVDSNGNNSCNNDEIATRINVVPNTSNNGRTGCICGRYRRR